MSQMFFFRPIFIFYQARPIELNGTSRPMSMSKPDHNIDGTTKIYRKFHDPH